MSDLQPDVSDILQEEESAPSAVPMCIVDQKAPLRTQALPRKGGATRTLTVGTTPVRVATADHRRARLQLITAAAANAYRVAFTETGAQDPTTMTVWPGAVPFESTATTEVWACAVTGTVDLGITAEQWAEGE
ncbi:hypothetical protein [Streptomyces sp. NBC_00470]|uniref:hypothetical protein n=1 Tax=Streptomyces sp. NBC_00470 TaxID=2975753 RepID=UPI0030E579F1